MDLCIVIFHCGLIRVFPTTNIFNTFACWHIFLVKNFFSNLLRILKIALFVEIWEFFIWLRWWRICLQFRRPRFNPWIGKIPWGRERLPTPVFLPGEFHGQRSLVGYRPWGCKELDTTEQLTFSGVFSLFFFFLLTWVLGGTLRVKFRMGWFFIKGLSFQF